MVGGTACSQAPVEIVGHSRIIYRSVTLVALTQAVPARRLSAAVVVRNNVAVSIGRIFAGTDPGDWRHFGAGWAGIHRTAAATAKKSVNRAVSPVIARIGITFFSNCRRCRFLRTSYWQQRHCRSTSNQYATQLAKKAAPRRMLCHSAYALFS